MSLNDTPQHHLRLIYDGECPFCAAYVKLLRLRREYRVELTDARSAPELVSAFKARGMDLDTGMVVEIDGVAYHGNACVERLALLTTPVGLFNRVNAWVFARPGLAAWVYPMLVWGRNGVLKLLGRAPLTPNN